MDFKDILLISDYDNTLTGEKHLVPQENIDAIRAFTAGGGAFTIGSGRGKREWYESFHHVPFNAPLVLSNGAFIYDTVGDRMLFKGTLTEAQKTLVKQLFLSLPNGAGGLIEVDEKSYIPDEIWETSAFHGFPGQPILHPPLDEIPDGWNKVSFMSPLPIYSAEEAGKKKFDMNSLPTAEMDQVERHAAELGLHGIRSLPFMYEVPPEHTDKGTSARKLQKILGKKVLAAAGDAQNDLAMLRAADICFVPEDSLLVHDGLVPENAVMCVRCEDHMIADVIRRLGEM